MTEPLKPWREGVPQTSEALERRAAALVERAHEIRPRAVDLAAGWDAVLKRATRPRTSLRALAFAGLASMLVGAVGTAGLIRLREPAVVAATGTQWERRDDGAVWLQRGRLQTSRATNLRVESPQVAIVARLCRFAAEVISEGTRVTVFEGTAVVRSGAGVERTLGPGESVLWPAMPGIPAALEPSEPANLGCSDVPCLERASQGSSLDAEVALFELGRRLASTQPERALEAWRTSLGRFPGGVFDPEVRLGLIVTLTRQRHFVEALAATRDFEATQPDDPRLDEVRTLQRQLEWLTTTR